jgi:integrase
MTMATDKLTDKGVQGFKPKKKSYKKSDGGGMYLLVMPNGSKLWQMGYRFGGRQRTLTIKGGYPEVSLADARVKRDEARALLRKGIDPHAAHMNAQEKAQPDAEEKVAAKTFGAWADEWLAKQTADGDSAKTITGKTNRVRILKATFGTMAISDISRAEVLAFLRELEQKGQLETRDRARSDGQKICAYADDAEDGGLNPFRPFDPEKLVEKKATPRPALTKAADVTKLFKAMAQDLTGLTEVVGLALRFLSLTAVWPGEIISAEWADIDLDAALWTIPASKTKMRREHVVPLSRQAAALLCRMHVMTGEGRLVFCTMRETPLAATTLNARLRFLKYDTARDHCAHGFRSTFSTLLNRECDKNDNKLWDSDLIELQLAHIEEASVKAIYNRTGPTSLIGARAKMMQHWADRIDAMVASGKVVSMVA